MTAYRLSSSIGILTALQGIIFLYDSVWVIELGNSISNGTKTWEVELFVLCIGITEWTPTAPSNGFSQGEGVTPLEVNMLVDQR